VTVDIVCSCLAVVVSVGRVNISDGEIRALENYVAVGIEYKTSILIL
jgi:hypothetical protein